MNVGLTYTYAGRLDEAVAECNSALELDSLSGWTYFCLAGAFARRGDIGEAVAAAEPMSRCESRPADAVYSLPNVHFARRRVFGSMVTLVTS